jgi:hypothetical protein
MIRDQLDPDMDLGHSDTQEMDEDEAAQARKLFGALAFHTRHSAQDCRESSVPAQFLRCLLFIKLELLYY